MYPQRAFGGMGGVQAQGCISKCSGSPADSKALCMPKALSLCSGGVMLVHDIRKNESQVIDFRETAPFGIQEEGLQKAWELKVGQRTFIFSFVGLPC